MNTTMAINAVVEKIRRLLLLALFLPVLSGCYYISAAWNHTQIMMSRNAVADVIADPSTPSRLRQQLILAQEIRDFSEDQLHLPKNQSYRTYADIRRNAVVWNITAAGEFSLQPHKWCYFVVGCLGYRGYTSMAAAQHAAMLLHKKNYDTQIIPVAAYSTLGWFDDPLLNTFINRNEESLARLMFHELAHQEYFRKDDSTFSESYANAVAVAGLHRWRAFRLGQKSGNLSSPSSIAGFSSTKKSTVIDGFSHAEARLIVSWRHRLNSLYDSDMETGLKREAKKKAFADFIKEYRQTMRPFFTNGIPEHTKIWLAGLNNATLAHYGTYNTWQGAFINLWRHDCKGRFACLHQQVRLIGGMKDEKRIARLQLLAGK